MTLGTARKNSSHNLNPYFRSLWVLAETGCHQAAHDFFPPHCRTAGEDTGVAHPSVEDSQEVCTTSFSTSPPSQGRQDEAQRSFLTPPLGNTSWDLGLAPSFYSIFLHLLGQATEESEIWRHISNRRVSQTQPVVLLVEHHAQTQPGLRISISGQVALSGAPQPREPKIPSWFSPPRNCSHEPFSFLAFCSAQKRNRRFSN